MAAVVHITRTSRALLVNNGCVESIVIRDGATDKAFVFFPLSTEDEQIAALADLINDIIHDSAANKEADHV